MLCPRHPHALHAASNPDSAGIRQPMRCIKRGCALFATVAPRAQGSRCCLTSFRVSVADARWLCIRPAQQEPPAVLALSPCSLVRLASRSFESFAVVPPPVPLSRSARTQRTLSLNFCTSNIRSECIDKGGRQL